MYLYALEMTYLFQLCHIPDICMYIHWLETRYLWDIPLSILHIHILLSDVLCLGWQGSGTLGWTWTCPILLYKMTVQVCSWNLGMLPSLRKKATVGQSNASRAQCRLRLHHACMKHVVDFINKFCLTYSLIVCSHGKAVFLLCPWPISYISYTYAWYRWVYVGAFWIHYAWTVQRSLWHVCVPTGRVHAVGVQIPNFMWPTKIASTHNLATSCRCICTSGRCSGLVAGLLWECIAGEGGSWSCPQLFFTCHLRPTDRRLPKARRTHLWWGRYCTGILQHLWTAGPAVPAQFWTYGQAGCWEVLLTPVCSGEWYRLGIEGYPWYILSHPNFPNL